MRLVVATVKSGATRNTSTLPDVASMEVCAVDRAGADMAAAGVCAVDRAGADMAAAGESAAAGDTVAVSEAVGEARKGVMAV
ncbi:hypothetical protein DPMN_125033 [Dreissena polymorpha]|uniref:Uncharacterized protein n=1 Tax=Dreissena polymorpha TaxID=45954 RepID=A0A9D4JUB9_DREPO|nr:hypothetical protein DPMN_125033 [Dreissena polymorpha]